ncbi:ankyrin repeat domain-containing protein SOWAHB [Brachyhypopomus gauderio]|uniref:ankyrin repeat domain-containing protein SOWAHB n=1 Tax=Brachyhypopomus gauderio TaxID=698409 RepID=UPI0040421695
MATDFTQEAVFSFLVGNGGVVRNASLLAHFNGFLRDHENQARNRELFKTFVNTLATVKQDGGVCYVALKKKYRPHLLYFPASKISSDGRSDKTREAGKHKVREGAATPAGGGGRDPGEPHRQASHLKPTQAPAVGSLNHTEHVLPVAGIVNNNNNNNDVQTVLSEKPIQALVNVEPAQGSPPHAWEPTVSVSPGTGGETGGDACTLRAGAFITDSKRSSGSGQSSEQLGELKGLAETAGPKHNGVYNAELGQSREADGCSRTSCALDYPYHEVVLTCPPSDTVHALNDRYHEEPWPFAIPLGRSQSYASSPCLADLPVASSCSRPYYQSGLSQSNDSLLRPIPGVYVQESDEYGPGAGLPGAAPQRRSMPLESLRPTATADPRGFGLHRGLSSSQSSLTLFPSEWPRQLARDDWSSEDALDVIMAEELEQGLPTDHRLREADLLAQLHCPERRVAPWHCSTGDLMDQETQTPPAGHTPPPGPIARRLSQRLRNRMCRSLGADLDQAAREDADSARLRRLRRISSFLSDRPGSALSVRTQSTLDGLSSAGSTRSLTHDSASLGPRHPQVPLEPREHEWFAKAAAGTWADVYSLFRDDPTLLAKRDFVSGYTVLHWIAKNGDHRVLNTLWYGVSKAGLRLDVDARSTCGYTPLHLAALHGHRKMLRLLVQKFRADVSLRDNSGKKPWQYLEKNRDWELLELLGAPQRASKGSAGARWTAEKPPVLAAAPSAATVKRHTSFAALFKHKPQLRVSNTTETFL